MRSAGKAWAMGPVSSFVPERTDVVRQFRSKPRPWWKDGRRHPEHLFIPDTQVRDGVPIEHVRWAAQYALDNKPDVIVFGHDWWDYPSLNTWESEYADFRTRDAIVDTCAGLHAFDLFLSTLRTDRTYTPFLLFCEGNHDERHMRLFRSDWRLRRGVPGPKHFVKKAGGIVWSPLSEITCVDGIHYSHYFVAPLTGKPLGGTALNKLTRLKFSFTMGHQQVKESAEQHLANGRVIRGLVAGAFYQHAEEYKGPQGNFHWRGIIYKHEVREGNYDLLEVSMDYLRRRYGGKAVVANGKWRAEEFTYGDDES